MKNEKPFNPLIDQNALKQWWSGQVKIANKTVKGPVMSGMSPDDECKERIYRALHNVMNGGKDEMARQIIDRELKMLRDHAIAQNDDALITATDLAQRSVFELDFNSPNLPMDIDAIRMKIYNLETY